MLFLGIDLGWVSRPSGVAALRFESGGLRLLTTGRLPATTDVVAWVDDVARDSPALVAVDAPILIGNETGMRLADRQAHVHFGRLHAGCYPANRRLPFAVTTVGFGVSLNTRGFRHAFTIAPRVPGRYQVEVFPHASLIQLCGLERILRYKKGRVAERAPALARLRDLIAGHFCRLDPPLKTPRLPDIVCQGVKLKEVEDQLDAVVCAYTGAYWWYWGRARNLVLGSEQEGYLVVPKRL